MSSIYYIGHSSEIVYHKHPFLPWEEESNQSSLNWATHSSLSQSGWQPAVLTRGLLLQSEDRLMGYQGHRESHMNIWVY